MNLKEAKMTPTLSLTATAVILGFSLLSCGTRLSTTTPAEKGSDETINLSTSLSSVGNQVSLPSNLSSGMNGTVVDTDADSTADGIDIDGNTSDAELIYLSGSLGKTAGRAGEVVGFYFRGNESVTYYFTVSNGKLSISSDEDGINNRVQILVDPDTLAVQGIDEDGDGNTENTTLSGVTVTYIPGEVSATVSGISGLQNPGSNISLTVGGSGITHYKYDAGTGSWSAETAVSTAITLTLPAASGSLSVKVIGKTADGTWQSEIRPTVVMIEYGYFYYIEVTGGDQNNSNKSNPAPPVELWAITTMYETSGYMSEKVKLTSSDGVTYKGQLPVIDANTRTIIIYDDVLDRVHLNGTPSNFSQTLGAQGYPTLPTDNYFSPCYGGYTSGPTSMQDQFKYNSSSAGTPVNTPPFFPVLASGSFSVGSPDGMTNDEVFYRNVAPAVGSTITVDYATDLTRANHGDYCKCYPNVAIPFTASPSNSLLNMSINLTDTDFGGTLTSPACVAR